MLVEYKLPFINKFLFKLLADDTQNIFKFLFGLVNIWFTMYKWIYAFR